ncbi:Nucleotide-binding universal stress protein, UspA family [Roseovarius azorensis]|uniref:Nucleotide-binding universal stress protein, UspA family n=1 Tax=Roseovarius azorensis TaxID=1287727 RepID=A0A1H7RGY7_9RHOB|nr:universal stress protein [Roseovarius azorensis]SEL59442.1 Nucleotide-binding universal stress protein, UspA family [Roseovarius azorensis]
MSGKFVVGYDGSVSARRALEFAVERARAQGGSIVLTHVLEWSPYSFLTPNELEERHLRRREEMERAEKAIMHPVVAELKDSGVPVETAIRYGNTADQLGKVAREMNAVQIVIGRDGQSEIGARIFGSVAVALVQTSPVACTIVP